MSLGRNTMAGLANSVWSALIGIAVVPLYLKYLGIEAYGLIGFFAMMQAVLSLLDLGLAATMNREVARYSAAGDLSGAGNLLHTLAVIYWIVALLIALIMVLIAPFAAHYWVQSKGIPQETVAHAIMLMGIVIACRWPISLYQSVLMGAQRMTISSGISIVMVSLGSLGAVAILEFVSPTVQAFFIWQACIGLLYAVVMRWAAWHIVMRKIWIKFDLEGLKRIWRFSAGAGGTAIVGLVLSQMDKILLSRMIALEDFGRYALAGMIAGGVGILTAPIFSAIYPRFSALASKANWKELEYVYRLTTRLTVTVLFPATFAIAFFAKDLVFVWTGNAELSASAAPLVMLLVLGTSLNGVMHFPYALQLACGLVWLPFAIAIALTILLVPMIVFLVNYHGVVGGAAAWLILNVIYLPFGTWLTHHYLLKGLGLRWILQDVCLPIVLSALIIGIGEYLLSTYNNEHCFRLLCAAGLSLSAMLFLVLTLPQVRSVLLNKVRLKST